MNDLGIGSWIKIVKEMNGAKSQEVGISFTRSVVFTGFSIIKKSQRTNLSFTLSISMFLCNKKYFDKQSIYRF